MMITLIILVTHRLIIVRSIGEDFLLDFLISSGAHIPIMEITAGITVDITVDITAGIIGATPPIIVQGLAHL